MCTDVFSYQRLWQEGKNLVERDPSGLSPCACSVYRVDLLAVNQDLRLVRRPVVHDDSAPDHTSGGEPNDLLGQRLSLESVELVLGDDLVTLGDVHVHVDLLSWGGFPPFRYPKSTGWMRQLQVIDAHYI